MDYEYTSNENDIEQNILSPDDQIPASYITLDEYNNIDNETYENQGRMSTSIQDLDIGDYPSDPQYLPSDPQEGQEETPYKYDAVNGNKQDAITAGIPDDTNMYPNILDDKPLFLAPVIKQQSDYTKPKSSFIKKISKSYLDIISDICDGNISKNTFTKNSRLEAIGVFLIILVLFIYFFFR